MNKSKLCQFVRVTWRVLFIYAALSLPILAQTTTATVSGIVRDEKGAVLPGVKVMAENIDTGISYSGITDLEGRYRISYLPPATYDLRTNLTGFRTAAHPSLKLTIGQEINLDFSLQVGAIAEAIVIQGDTPLLDKTKPELGGLVDSKKVRDLPLNGRSYEQLALLQPGVVFYPNASKDLQFGAGTKFVVSGSRPQSNLFLLDGSDINDQADFTPGSAAGVVLGVETLREFKVLTHTYSAEYGRKSGGIINAVTQSGTNALQGNVFHFLRNDNLDARNFFDRQRPPEFKRNQFGATAGGPLVRGRTFAFGGYEGLRERLGLSYVTVLPNAAAHKGCVPDRNQPGQLRCVGVDPHIKPYLDLLPLPNGTDNGDGSANYFSSPTRATRGDNFTIRVDHQFSPQDSFFARYTFDDAKVFIPDKIPAFALDLKSRYQYLTLEERRILSNRLLNVLRVSFNRSYSDTQAVQTIGPTPELAFVPGQKIIGNINIDPIRASAFGGGIGPPAFLPRTFAYNLFEYSDDLNYTTGRHAIKAGANVKRNQLNAISLALNTAGTFSFRTIEDFLKANPYLFNSEAPGSDTQRAWRQTIFGFYVQDDVKLKQHLTVNVGLRYEFVTIPKEIHGKASYLSRVTAPEVTMGAFWPENPSLKDFGPRVGFAWDAFKNGKTVIRGGFGLYYDLPVSYFYSVTGSRTYPFHFTGTVTNPLFPNALAGIFRPSARDLVTFDSNLSTPTKIHYNLNTQHEISPGLLFSVGYVGASGYHLLRHMQVNHFVATILPNGSRFFPANAPRVNPNFNSIRQGITDATSSYHSLQVGLNRRWAQGAQFQVSYTWSKSLDTNSGAWGVDILGQESFIEDPYNLRNDRGLSGFDVRHALTLNYTYELFRSQVPSRGWGKILREWQISGITVLTTGLPFTVVSSSNLARTYPGTTRSRPNLRSGASPNPILGGPDRYFDPTAFEPQAAGFPGTLGRNTLIGPGLVNFDLSLVKSFPLSEKRRLQFRTDCFNIFNHANFATPLRVVFDANGNRVGTAGQIRETVTTSRQLQLALKLFF